MAKFRKRGLEFLVRPMWLRAADVEDIEVVFNYDLPTTRDYVHGNRPHRARGRTAGRSPSSRARDL